MIMILLIQVKLSSDEKPKDEPKDLEVELEQVLGETSVQEFINKLLVQDVPNNPLELALREWFAREELMLMLENLVEEVLGEESNEEFIYILMCDDNVIKELRRHFERLKMAERKASPDEMNTIVEQVQGELVLLVEQKRGTRMFENKKKTLRSFLKLGEALYKQLDDKTCKDICKMAAQMTVSSNLKKLLENDR